MKIKTDELPVATRRPQVYQATIKSFELRTSQNSGEPNISIVLEGWAGKRFDRINLKRKFFDDTFDPSKLDPQSSEAIVFRMAFGERGRPGNVQRFLGEDDFTIDTPEELTARLNEVAVGKTFWVVEKQKYEGGFPTQNYNLRYYTDVPSGRSLPKDAVMIEAPASQEVAV